VSGHWEALNGPELGAALEDVRKLARRYVVMSNDQSVAFGLFSFHTHTFEAVDYSPLLAITSPEMRSGKTTLMKLLALICAEPWRVITPSEAVVFRKIHRDHPTLLLDEYDTIFQEREYEPLRAILNAGNEPGTHVPRCVGPSQQLEDFAVYCPKVLAGIGRLPTTVADRAIEIALKRKAPGETVARFRRRVVAAEAEPLQQALASLAEHHFDALAEARPELPDELDDRAQDAWEPLLAIADLAGGDWPELAREAALALSDGRASANEDSDRLLLLADIRDVYDRLARDHVLTVELITELAEVEESPWAEWWDEREDKPKKGAAMNLARELRPFGIRSTTVRTDSGRAKGYKRDDFEDAWARYVPLSGTQSRDSRDNPHEYSDSGHSESRDTTPFVTTSEEAANPHEQSDVTAVTASNPENGGGDVSEAEVERLAEVSRRVQHENVPTLDELDLGTARLDEIRAADENEQAVLAEVAELVAEGVLIPRDEAGGA
jgi:hypothetical protein